MTAHTTDVRHTTHGWLRWVAVCCCGWTRPGMGRGDAQRIAREHVRSAA